MKKTLFIIAVFCILLLSGCKPKIMIAQEIANEVELEVEECDPKLEKFELPTVNADYEKEYSVNWTSDNPLIEIKYEDGKYIAYLNNDYETEITYVLITLEVTVGNKTAYKRFNFTVGRKITQAELDYKYDFIDNNYIIIKEYIGRTTDDTLVIPNAIYHEDGDGNPSNNYKTVKVIDEEAFSNNFYGNETIKKVVIPASVEEIKTRAFAYNTNLGEIVFEGDSNLRSIEDEAFIENSSLTSFTIPSKVQYIGQKVFLGTSITEFVSNDTFEWKDNVLFGKNTGVIDHYYAIYVNPFAEAIRFPDEVKTIESYICLNNKHIKTVDFNQVWGVGLDVFMNSSLENIINYDNIKDIDLYALYDTPWLNNQEVDFITLGDCLLKYNGNEEHVVIPDNIITIGMDAFKSPNIKSVYIGRNVKDIGTNAFGGCSNLEWIVLGHFTPPWFGSETSFGKAILYVSNVEIFKDAYWYLGNEISTKSVNVKFYDIDNNLLNEISLNYLDVLEKQNAPQIKGYKFVGWIDSNGNVYKEYDIFDCYYDVELIAYYEKSN